MDRSGTSCSEAGHEYLLKFFVGLDQKVVKYRIGNIRSPWHSSCCTSRKEK